METGSLSVEVNAENFQAEVAEKSQQVPVLLEFYAEGAEQCESTSALLQKLASEYQGKVSLARVEVQQNPQLVQQLQIRALPTIKIIFQGQMAGDIEGPADEQQLRGALEQLTMSPLERVREQIDFLVLQGERKQAIQMLQQVIAEEPNNFSLHVELCDLLIMEGEVNDARQILEALPADTEGLDRPKSRLEFIDLAGELGSVDELTSRAESGDLHARFDLAIRLIVEDQVEHGLETLLEILKADKTWEEEKARLTMIKVFNMLGKGNELATSYRRKMFTYLH
ncbi:MAG: tetratricopeptide repeat protein [Pseudomonadales bacterium]|nr:tetratricopeptide repeat protein [Pseudomonadales bacterium]MBO6594391.1 tetratricopeptide repeat protein [Pseudomonadales bacterium]MBO6655567.1 tetratricopeptide repeat protein [Pseudomonadales bacterium]MBO6700892.1 tetratricopeptide repeat protein [Pseudomonadales bacterium]MBO6822048.1 tetratricopeptide repeat protein [Pseudomonadales bacterium]